MPLIAVMMTLSWSFTFSFFRWFLRYGEGVTKTSVWQLRATSLMSVVKLMRSMSKRTLVRYEGLCPCRLNSSTASGRRIYHQSRSTFSRSILAMAVAQLPLPSTAMFPKSYMLRFSLYYIGRESSPCGRPCQPTFHPSMSCTEGFAMSSLYFLMISPICCCTFCGFTSRRSLTR